MAIFCCFEVFPVRLSQKFQVRARKSPIRSVFPEYFSVPYDYAQATGTDPEILKRSGALCRLPCLADEENFRFQMVLKGQNNDRSYKSLAKYFYQHYQIFSFSNEHNTNNFF